MSMAFDDVDVGEGGKINVQEFGLLCGRTHAAMIFLLVWRLLKSDCDERGILQFANRVHEKRFWTHAFHTFG